MRDCNDRGTLKIQTVGRVTLPPKEQISIARNRVSSAKLTYINSAYLCICSQDVLRSAGPNLLTGDKTGRKRPMTRPPSLFDRFRQISIVVGVLIFAALNAGPVAAQGATTPPLTAAQIEQLVAPIALYPDSLLSQILMASTYPLEVVAAARWSQANPTVTGDALQTAMVGQSWDPSVKALTALPQTLQMMSDKLEWTQQLGDAFLAQQDDVLNAVQQLRARADANGQLKSTPEQKVTTTTRSAGQPASTAHRVEAAPANIYAIESTNPDEYYVPIYDPGTVYGTWPYTDYPPYYWYPPGYAAGSGLAFGAGILVGSAIWGNINWNRNFLQINPLRYNNFNRTNIANIGNGNWTHNPAHRGAVPYRGAGVAQRYGQQGQSAAREAFRGKSNAGRGELGKLGAAGAAGVAAGKLGQKGAAGLKGGAAKTAAGKKHWRGQDRSEQKRRRGQDCGRQQGSWRSQDGSE